MKALEELGNGVEVRTLIEAGNPAEKIISLAEKETFELIIIGSRGLSNTTRFFMGSVSFKVVNHAPCLY